MSVVSQSVAASLKVGGKGKRNAVAKVDVCAVQVSSGTWDTSQLFDAATGDTPPIGDRSVLCCDA